MLLGLNNSYYSQIIIVIGSDSLKVSNESEYLKINPEKKGYWIYFYPGGIVKKQEGNYISNKKEGIWKTYYSTGKTESVVTYINGLPDGKASFYYKNGNLKEEGIWKIKFWTGEYSFYYENGKPFYRWQYNDSGKRTGNQMYFYENGNLMIEGKWDDGKESGKITEYHENGSLKSEKIFVEGKIDTSNIKIYERTEITPVKGLDKFSGNGYYKTITKTGNPDFDGIWKNGNFIEGNRYIYDENDKLIKIYVYRNGIKIGEKNTD